jgi:subtilisin family serine protease
MDQDSANPTTSATANNMADEQVSPCKGVYNYPEPCDDDQHGTHTTGTMAGDDRSQNHIGVSPDSKWIACRNMDAGFGSPATYLECFQYFLAPHPAFADPFTAGKTKYAPHVINNSWGCPPEEGCSGAEILPALKAMKAAGIMVVASAGNEGPECGTINNPPAYHSAWNLSVGAYDHRTLLIANFSSRGPSTFDQGEGPTVTAPGVQIRSAIPGGRYDHVKWSGTSMAGPHVAGQVGLMWDANPKLIGKIDETIRLIKATALPVPLNTITNSTDAEDAVTACGSDQADAPHNNTYGYGRINIYESVKAAKAWPNRI